MREDAHERARRLIDRHAAEGVAAADQEWLESHLGCCAECAGWQAATASAVALFRGVSALPRPALVTETRRKVHERALELQRQTAIQRPLWIACGLSWLWMLLTTPYFWRAFAWLGAAAGVPAPVWQAAFLLAWFLPATIAGAVVAWKRWHRSAEVTGEAERVWRPL